MHRPDFFMIFTVMKLYRTGLLLLAVLCTIPVFAGQPPRLKVGSSSGIFGPVTNWTYETFAEAKRAGIDAIEISASTLFLNKEMTDDRQIEARCRQLKRDLCLLYTSVAIRAALEACRTPYAVTDMSKY